MLRSIVRTLLLGLVLTTSVAASDDRAEERIAGTDGLDDQFSFAHTTQLTNMSTHPGFRSVAYFVNWVRIPPNQECVQAD